MYQRIESLSAEIVQETEQKHFEQVTQLLQVRLSLLKQLTEEELAKGDDDTKEALRNFLISCQETDASQLNVLAKERTKLLADGQQQSKVKQAVNTYQKFSG